jgi:cystathionine beta-lyase/cystathionine gamma-synthase
MPCWHVCDEPHFEPMHSPELTGRCSAPFEAYLHARHQDFLLRMSAGRTAAVASVARPHRRVERVVFPGDPAPDAAIKRLFCWPL